MRILITSSKAIAILSFIIGTSLFALQLYNKNAYPFVRASLVFIGIATVVNSIAVLSLVYTALKPSKYRKESLKTIGIMLLNIPIVLLYFCILIEVL
jgi:hypothetical protein